MNNNLNTYDGKQNNISNLYVDEPSGSAGLFGKVKVAGGGPATVRRVRLTDAVVKGSGSAAALAGSAKNTTFTDIRVVNATATVSGDYAGGLVGNAEDATFSDIRVVNAAATASGDYAGGLAGSLEDSTLTNCQVYWDDDNLEKLVSGTAIKYKVSGENAGGLIGCASGTVKIDNSFATTTVSGTDVGGLVASASDEVGIEGSYADCYLEGIDNAGGLVGSGDASLKNCYAAGFITGGANTAGLATGSAVVSTGGGVYSIVRMLKDNSLQPPAEPLADGLAEVDGGNARYLFTADGTEGAFGAPFKSVTAGRTHAYDLRYRTSNPKDETLKLEDKYPYPGLEDLPHYSDWADLPEKMPVPAGLAYYEEYSGGYDGGKGYGTVKYGVVGRYEDVSIDTGLPTDTEINYNHQTKEFSALRIEKDGYALVLKGKAEDILPVLCAIEYGGKSYEWSGTNYFEITFKKEATEDTAEETTYYTLFPLPDGAVTGAWDNISETHEFYQELTTVATDEADNRAFYFNPHFAKTVRPVEKDADGNNKPAPADLDGNEGNISVRTPRHFWHLSGIRWGIESLPTQFYTNRKWSFKQELDLDYSTYTGYNGIFAPKTGALPFTQAPVGSEGNPFAGIYDGGCHTIRKVVFKAGGSNMGLFGYIRKDTAFETGLRNIVYELDLKNEISVVASDHATYLPF